MKISIEQQTEPVFKPFTVVITIVSQEDVEALMNEADALKDEGLYDKGDPFEKIYETIIAHILNKK